MSTIQLDGLDAAITRFSQDLDALLPPVLVGVATELQDYISPYPPALPGNGRTYYERGYGTKSVRTKRGRKTSEMLGRRWSIQRGNPALLINTASYAAYVHAADDQARVHAGRWKTDDDGATHLETSTVIAALVEDVLQSRFGL